MGLGTYRGRYLGGEVPGSGFLPTHRAPSIPTAFSVRIPLATDVVLYIPAARLLHGHRHRHSHGHTRPNPLSVS